ncbi:MAG: hypothetical protein A2474_00260 [Elusimicrobia bacterium RIFOXYC2_FULL_34_12]|nr:MAG: hypothetical protein A2474_00260 [Elusimicrobia bacterium RIFOXYC2_FULL_34_12]
MKKICLLLLLFIITNSFLFSDVRIGTEVETGGVLYSNPNYGRTSGPKNKYMFEKTRFYLEGDLKNNVVVGFKILSRGIFGKDFGKEYTTVKSSITFINYTPQIENAFIKFKKIKEFPIDLTVGRQPIKIGQGVLVDDDGLGFDALRLQGTIPIVDIMADTFLIKRTEMDATQYTEEKDETLYSIGGNWTYDKDYHFRIYYFIEESSAPLKKNFISLRVDGRFKKGVDYRAEIIKAGGDYSGLSYLVGLTAYSKIKRLGTASVNLEYAVGNGQNNGLGFAPTYGHKTDGFERAGYGEYFGASLSDFYGGINNSKSDGQGIHTTLLGLGFEPYKNLHLNFDYYVLFSLDFPELSDQESYLGEEFDIKASYKYTENCSINLLYGKFSPLGILKTAGMVQKVSANKIGWSISAKF